MRFRTKLFISGGATVLLPLAGMAWPVGRTLHSSFDRIAAASFCRQPDRARASLQSERVSRMRHAGALVMSIPELRALIAEHNYEISPPTTPRQPAGAGWTRCARWPRSGSICVLDGSGALIAQSRGLAVGHAGRN